MNETVQDTNGISAMLDTTMRQFFLPLGEPGKSWPTSAQRVTVTMQTPTHWLEGPQLELVAHCIGQGPAVLLVHGWQSQGADLLAMAQVIAAKGYSVWVPDMPAHGHSQGSLLSIPLAALALLQWQQHVGGFVAAIGHSVGGACVVHALTQGLCAEKVVLIASPTHFGRHVRSIAESLGFPLSYMPLLLQKMEHAMGVAPDAIDMLQQAQTLAQQPLFIHAPDDKVVAYAHTERVARAWPGARWQAVAGLGHFRIVQDAQVHQLLLQMLQDA